MLHVLPPSSPPRRSSDLRRVDPAAPGGVHRASMGLLRHLHACNAHDLRNFCRFLVDGRTVGWIRHALAERLRAEPAAFAVTPDAVALAPGLTGFEARTAAVAEVLSRLVAEGVIRRLRGEQYAVLARWGDAPLLKLDRAAVPFFGVRSLGIRSEEHTSDL